MNSATTNSSGEDFLIQFFLKISLHLWVNLKVGSKYSPLLFQPERLAESLEPTCSRVISIWLQLHDAFKARVDCSLQDFHKYLALLWNFLPRTVNCANIRRKNGMAEEQEMHNK